MKHQGFHIEQSAIFSAFSIKCLPSTLPLQVGLTAFLLAGVTILPLEVNASSFKLSQVVVPTETDSTPATTTTPASAKVIYVNPAKGEDRDSFGETEGTPYKTITYALSRAESNTLIQLAPGSYIKDTGEVFPLVIKPGVILRGDESTKGQTTTIIGGAYHISRTFARQDVTIRAEKDSTITGVTITNPNTRGTALWIESTNPTVKNNTFINSKREGIFVTGTGSPKIENNVFTNNSANGISVAKAAKPEIRNNFFQSTGFGIAIGGTSSPLVAENQITQNNDGIFISDSARPVLRNNVIENNTRDGVVAITNSQPDLGTAESTGKNIIRSNGRYDLNNATKSNQIVAVGNDIDPSRISGPVSFVAASIERPEGSQGAFRDVQGYWAQPYIEALAAKNIIAGFPDGTFKPDEPVTRAQFAAIVSKAFDATSQREQQEFSDVSPNFWAYQPIQKAYQTGFITGYPGRVFQPQQQIPRVQVLVSLANGLKLRSDNPSAVSFYTDASLIPGYATAPVAAATQRQLVVNYPTLTQLNPNRQASRAEVAAFVYQALVNSGRAEAIPSPYVVKLP